MWVGYMAPYNFLNITFDFSIPTKDVAYKEQDGSKMCDRLGCGIFIKGSNTKLSFRLPDHCSVFQAEVMAIQKAEQCLLGGRIFYENLLIYSDSQAAINSVTYVVSTSVLVHECRRFLTEISEHSNVTLI